MYTLLTIYKVIALQIFTRRLSAVNPACECVIMRKSSFRESGIFNSPNYPSPYPPLINCILYTFIGSLEDIVEIHFIDFNTQPHITNRCADYVKMYLDLEKPEVNEKDMWNYDLCGNISTASTKHYSSTPYLIFEFHTDNIHTNHTGFKGTFRFYKKSDFQTSVSARWGSNCTYDFNSNTFLQKGKFFSPLYPRNYLPDSHCFYHFYGKPQERVALHFREIELEEYNKNCKDSPDRILVRDGIDENSPILTWFCNKQHSQHVISSVNTAAVEFVSNSRNQRKGFSATFVFLKLSKLMPNENVSIKTTFHPYHKQLYIGTRNLLVVGESWRQDFEMQKLFKADDILVEPSSAGEINLSTLQPLKEARKIPTFTPLIFLNNIQACNHTYLSGLAKSGYFTSPGYPIPFSPHLFCRFTFQGELNERVQIIFTDFDLSGPEESLRVDPYECEDFDELIVTVRIKNNTRNLINQCGGKIPSQLMSHDNMIEVTFISKHHEVMHKISRGFKAIYKFVTDFGITSGQQKNKTECGFTYRSVVSKNGSFTSPNFPGLYPRNTECHYIFYGEHSENIIITFKAFNVEGISPTCGEDTQSDYVEFSNFNIQLIDRKMIRICGPKKETGNVVISTGNFFRVTFKSNDVYDSTGFIASYLFNKIKDPTVNKIHKSRALYKPFKKHFVIFSISYMLINLIVPCDYY